MNTITVNLHQNSPTSSLLTFGEHELIIDRPIDKGGQNQGPMGGQVLLMSVGGCFCSTLYAAAQAREIVVEDLKLSIHGTLSEGLPKRFQEISLEVLEVQCSHPEEFAKLLKIAENGCIAVNTIKQGLDFKVTN